MDVIVFNKTKHDRLKEFQDVLSPDVVPKVTASTVAAQWSFYLELTVEPVGWQALWKLPRHQCQHYNLRFPTVLLVEVKNVDYKELTAFIEILKVQESVNIPSNHEADLKNLYITQHQENAVDAEGTANALDQLRFFYNHLWRPWDCEDSENEDWLSNYLEPRLELYYDIQQGLLSRETAERISKLLAEGREIYREKRELEMQFDDGVGTEDALSSGAADAAYALLQLHIKLEPIKTELRILENPTMRSLLEKKIADTAEIEKREPEKYVVCNGLTLGKYIEFLKSVEVLFGPETSVKPNYSLQAGLDMAQAGDTFVLPPGVHNVTGSGRLEEGGCISGIDKKLSAILRHPKASNFLLDVGSGTLSVENVTVDANSVDMAFLVRPRGTLDLTNVQLDSPKCTVGVVVLPGGHLRLKHCEFKNCQIGVYCHPGGSVIMSNSVISGCSVGLQVKQFGNTKVKIEDSLISDCRNVAIDVVDLNLSATGPVEILKDIIGFSCSNFETKANKADVTIQQHNSALEVDEPGCL